VLSILDPASALAIGLLIFALLLVMAFEATNGFHDAAVKYGYVLLGLRK
jgi:divalent metal cation (Fe/Co/Zn/Cd) transporter